MSADPDAVPYIESSDTPVRVLLKPFTADDLYHAVRDAITRATDLAAVAEAEIVRAHAGLSKLALALEASRTMRVQTSTSSSRPVSCGGRPPAPTIETPARPLILLVDDDPVVRLTLARALTERGYDVCTAADGQAAMSYWRRSEPAIRSTRKGRASGGSLPFASLGFGAVHSDLLPDLSGRAQCSYSIGTR